MRENRGFGALHSPRGQIFSESGYSNREPEATARGDAVERRKTRRREAGGGRSPRRTVAPNESEPLSKPDRPGQRVFERDAQNPTEAGAVMGAGVAGHSVFLLREIHVGPRER